MTLRRLAIRVLASGYTVHFITATALAGDLVG
jgi:hypothetical protein